MPAHNRSGDVVCNACGRKAHGNYCSNCGTSMDAETQRHVSALYWLTSERDQRRAACETLKTHAETEEEREVLERIKERI